jgi:hypothetical protein
MPNPSTDATHFAGAIPARSPRLLGALAVFIFAFISFFTFGPGNIVDPFHQGEFFATLPSMLHAQPGQHAFTIHGALDFLPAWIATHFSSLNNNFLYTQFAYAVCNLGAALLLYLIAALFVEKGSKYEMLILLTVAAVSSQLVGYRDLFLLLSIYLFLLCLRSHRSSDFFIKATLLGVAAAFNIFWSYDRGITGFGSVGFGVFLASFIHRRFIYAIVVFIGTFLVLSLMTEVFSLSDYLRNLDFLLSTSSQWSYRNARFLIQSALLTVPTVFAYYALFRSFPKPFRFSPSIAVIGMLSVLILVLYKVATNRADFIHVPMGMWAPLLSFLFAYDQLRKSGLKADFVLFKKWIAVLIVGSMLLLGLIGKNPMPFFAALLGLVLISNHRKFLGYSALMALSALLVAFTLYKSPVPNVLANGYKWLPNMTAPPQNDLLVSEGAQWAANQIKASGSQCVFDLSNNGIINGVTGLPACTKYIYPVYATRVYEQDMISDLKKSDPSVVIYSTTFWSFNINDISMHDKFPELKKYLDEKYPYEKCESEYCLRFKKAQG